MSDSVCPKHQALTHCSPPIPSWAQGSFHTGGIWVNSGVWEWDSEMQRWLSLQEEFCWFHPMVPSDSSWLTWKGAQESGKGLQSFPCHHPLEGGLGMKPLVQSYRTNTPVFWFILLLKGFSSKIWFGSGILWKCHGISPQKQPTSVCPSVKYCYLSAIKNKVINYTQPLL